jgi:hypothetical protein
MNKIKEQLSKITANPIGAVAGGAIVFFVGKKYIANKWLLAGATALGVIGGSMAQAKFGAKKPTVVDATPKK